MDYSLLQLLQKASLLNYNALYILIIMSNIDRQYAKYDNITAMCGVSPIYVVQCLHTPNSQCSS